MKARVVLAILAFVFAAVVVAEKTRYDGMSVIRITNANPTIVESLEAKGYDIWARTNDHVDVMLPAAIRAQLTTLNFTTMIEDVQVLIDQDEADVAARRAERERTGAPFDWNTEYHTFESIVAYTKELAGTNPSLCTFNPNIGTSLEGRNLVSISLHGGNGGANVPQIVIIAGQHAREWIAPATTMYMLQQLVGGYGTDPEVTTILDRANLTIIPIVNPDGYDFAWTSTRLWRKNRRRNAGGSFGVDLNRNWDDHWCETGASKVPSSDTYCGTGPFSEPESTAAAKLISSLAAMDGNNTAVKLALDMHSYSQLILRPYGWTTRNPPNVQLLTALGANMANLIRGVHGKSFINQAAIDLYPTTGSAEDWFYGPQVNVPITYTFELRDTGAYGFILPANQIIPSGQEIWKAVEYLLYSTVTSLKK